MSTADTDLPVLGQVFLQGILTVRTGLHVGASQATIRMRGIDAPVVRLPLLLRRSSGGGPRPDGNDSVPYIPGSSLRGKLRSLLERKIFGDAPGDDFFQRVITVASRPIRLHTCQKEACPICRLFGTVPLEHEKISRPSSLYIFDLQLLGDSLLQKGSLTEAKMENCLDRTTQASNPRQIERIGPGTNFRLKIRYWVKNPDFVEGDLTNLFAALKLLEDDALGGHGSRGYGAVKVGLTEIYGRRFGDQPEDLRKTVEKDGQAISIVSEVADLFRKRTQVTAAQMKAQGSEVISLIKLRFLSPLHIGEVGIGLEECAKHSIPSDTLFSAISNAWVLRYGTKALGDLLEEFQTGTPPFFVSSAFPYSKETLFFPRPYSPPGRDEYWEKEQETPRKKLKDLIFLPTQLFIRWLKQVLTPEQRRELEHADDQLKNELATRELLPKVRLDRIEATSNLFFCGLTNFAPDSGLFFLVRAAESALGQLKGVVDILGEVGIGGERSAGCGQFEAKWTEDARKIDGLDVLFSDKPPPAVYCTLSLYHPSSDEFSYLRGKLQGYDLVERGGWVESPFFNHGIQKQRCRMFREGSIFTFRPSGQLVNVTPKQGTLSHEVYRNGLAFAVGVGQ